jgi:predicted small integral membrane protein
MLKLLLVLEKKLITTLVYETSAICFAKNWQNSQKIVIITSTPGVNVRISILVKFSQFTAYNLAIFLETNVLIIFCVNGCNLSQNRQLFLHFFLASVFPKLLQWFLKSWLSTVARIEQSTHTSMYVLNTPTKSEQF